MNHDERQEARGQFGKTWGEVFNHHLNKGEDHGSAAYAADQYAARAKAAGKTLPVRNSNWSGRAR